MSKENTVQSQPYYQEVKQKKNIKAETNILKITLQKK